MASQPLTVLTGAEIDLRIQGALRHWRFDGRFLSRSFRTGGWKASMMIANAIAHLAEAAWHHPELTVTYPAVEVRLETHDAGGITLRDIELAARIEDVVAWTPGPGSALEGTPSDPAHRYLLPDA